jgi:hypothetical protein
MNQSPRIIGDWLLVMAGTALVLGALDRVPGRLLGIAHGVRLFDSIASAERALGTPVWLPEYYPEGLAWPPRRIEATADEPLAVAVRIAGRGRVGERLSVVQTLGGASTPSDLLPPGTRLGANEVAVGRHRGTLVRLLIGTQELHDVTWLQAGRRVTLRYSGPVDRLLLIAGSLERRVREKAR